MSEFEPGWTKLSQTIILTYICQKFVKIGCYATAKYLTPMKIFAPDLAAMSLTGELKGYLALGANVTTAFDICKMPFNHFIFIILLIIFIQSFNHFQL